MRSRTLYGCVDWNYQFAEDENECEVAPYTGAWIETPHATRRARHASRTLYGCVDWNGNYVTIATQQTVSHPIRVRGLKHCCSYIPKRTKTVAPYTGAWIETCVAWQRRSPPGRTLYGCVDWNDEATDEALVKFVAPYTGAWIETPEALGLTAAELSHPIRVRGLKRHDRPEWLRRVESHPIRVRGLEQRLLLPPSGQYKVAPTWVHELK